MNFLTDTTKRFLIILIALAHIFVLNTALLTQVLAAGNATLSLSPSSSSVANGTNFDVQIVLNTGGARTSGTDISLRFDQTKLNIVDIKNGSIYDQYVGKNINNTSGIVTISGLASSTSSLYTGTGTFATITFKAVGSGTASVTFNYTAGNKNDTNVADFDTQDEALSNVTNGSYTITGGGSSSGSTTNGTSGTSGNSQTGSLPVTASSFPLILIAVVSVLLLGSGIYFWKFYKRAQ
jgi:hypothetical protein